MENLFRKHPHAIARIQEIIARCNFSLKQLSYQFLKENEGGETPMQKLERLTWEGAAFRYPKGVSEKITQNIRKEFALIAKKEDRALLPDRA